MSENPRPELQFAIDRLASNGTRIFGWGWAAHPSRSLAAISIVARGEAWERRLPAQYGLLRVDVERAFPRLRNAGTSGFVVTGYTPRQPVRRLMLELEFDDGERAELDVTSALDARSMNRRRFRAFAWVARALLRRLRRGDLRGILSRARMQNYAAPSLDDEDVVARLLPRMSDGRAAAFVFDHNLGGGANKYRRSLIAERLAAGARVLLCTYNLPTLDYRLQVFEPGGAEDEIYRMPSFAVLDPLLGSACAEEIFVNSPVSFDEPLAFAEWISAVRASHPRLRLTVAMHDYFAVCPSFVLLNADGRYCGVPDISECAACLKRHQAHYVALSPPTEIGAWRALWGRCLQLADEVRCFSDSTRRLLLRAYPSLDVRRVTVIPHRVEYLPPRVPRLDHAAPLTIGIIGHISEQKGAQVVREIVRTVERDHPGVRVVVIGTLDVAVASPRLKVTGAFRHEALVDLIESNHANLFLFPSVCPETFSYVTEEMMALGLPVVAFDLGAPGERLRGYAEARLCPEVSAGSALATLLQFHRELAARQTALA